MLRQESQELVKVGIKCQGCGNSAKRDCQHSRCRTCCRNLGLECETHVKSTWRTSPAKKRQREQQQPLQGDNPGKRQKLNPPSGFEEENHFPEALSTIGIFRRLRLHSGDGAIDEEAYQATVNIGGHSFSGILYDQGPPKLQGVEAANDNAITNPQQQQRRDKAAKTSLGGAIVASSSAATAPAPSPPTASGLSLLQYHQQTYPPTFNSFNEPLPPPFFDLRK
ncbi:hypothetical protein L6164_033475 [Bauhinia variegata]|uniref:Uncharacterized protein n=1 Tax=Bauhinia variegata TaxID=167791 RepID=A0ACB9KS47_BAUVA|nr:hypothetical protein L6164_033475 [Bauhinia variegata]